MFWDLQFVRRKQLTYLEFQSLLKTSTTFSNWHDYTAHNQGIKVLLKRALYVCCFERWKCTDLNSEELCTSLWFWLHTERPLYSESNPQGGNLRIGAHFYSTGTVGFQSIQEDCLLPWDHHQTMHTRSTGKLSDTTSYWHQSGQVQVKWTEKVGFLYCFFLFHRNDIYTK